MGQALGCSDELTADLAPVQVSTDMAIPLALIVNELVTNAVKHGGPTCSVSTATTPDGLLTLTVSDSGGGRRPISGIQAWDRGSLTPLLKTSTQSSNNLPMLEVIR